MRTQLKEGEQVVLTIRRHWFVLIAPVFSVLVVTILIILALVNMDSAYKHYLLIVELMALLWLVYKVLSRRTDIWVVTNLRVIDEYGVFSSNSIETPLDKVNNVSYSKPLLGRIFNYGHVQIQSAAEDGSTYERMLERPTLLKDTITEHQGKFRDESIRKHAESIYKAAGGDKPAEKRDIIDELERLSRLLESGAITREEFEKAKAKLLED